MSYLAYHPITRPTGRRLANALGFRTYGTFVRRGRRIPTPQGTLIRWGNARFPDIDDTSPVLNPASAILRASDKPRAFRCFQEAEGIRVPETALQCPGDGVVLARSRRGFGGRDIQVCEHNPCVRADFYSTFIPNDREYRLHVVGEDVVRVQRKYLQRPDLRRSEYVKNHSNGYVFEAPARRLNTSRLNMAVAAVKALGLDFGAVDMIVDHQGEEYVLEVNTAPACSPLTLRAYVDAFMANLGEQGIIVTPDYHEIERMDDDDSY